MAGRRVVVTGGAGFIGVHSVEALLEAGADVMVIDDLRHESYRPLPAAARLENADVAEAPARAAITAWRPAAILHLAAQGGVNRSWREPAADAHINVLGTVSVLSAAIAAGCRRVVVASSGGALYGAASRLPTPEEEPSKPRSPYGTAKLCIEHYLGHFTRAGALDALALRYGNVYGPGQDGTGEAGVVAISSSRLLAGRAPVIRGDGSQTRDFTYVGDIVAANLLGLGSTVTGAVNIGTGQETAIGDLVRSLCALAGYRDEPVAEPLPPGEVTRSALDNTRAGRELGWHPEVTLEDGLARTFESFRAQAR
ncbi:MAG TPA: NAD-dependent epimerase/dehydratase family protein [Candidatus Acidoferrales bacterium]|nr:NAD-dependent epimerase/dehydratase family protein [Candidatus Acidoferrales bacterium]